MQQPTHPMASMPPMANQNITTEQIQKYLDENKQLILAILDNQNLGKLTECAQYQAQLQKNLLYLAAIADAQPPAPAPAPAPAARPQTMPHGAMPQGGHYMQQGPMFAPRAPMQFNPQQMQEQQQQQQLHHQPQVVPFPGHMGMRPGAVNGMHAMHAEPSLGGSADLRPAPSLTEFPQGNSTPSISVDGRGSKQDVAATASEPACAADDHRNSGTERSGDGEPNISDKV